MGLVRFNMQRGHALTKKSGGDLMGVTKEPTDPTVIFIMGRPHSGSTIVSAMLGNARHSLSVGELYTLRSGMETVCTCGAALNTCVFWSRVKADFELECGDGSWAELSGWIGRMNSAPHILSALTPLGQGFSSQYVARYRMLYRSLCRVADAHVVVDASRNPFHAFHLLKHDANAKILFLIRNGEDALYSKLWRLEQEGTFSLLQRKFTGIKYYAPYLFAFSLSWVIGNLVGEVLIRRFPDRVYRLKYEELGSDPDGLIKNLGSFLGMDLSELAERLRGEQPIAFRHEVGGNRIRFKGALVFSPKKVTPLPRRYAVPFRIVAWPMMKAYGYFKR
jgi:hypothetical protein